MSTLEDFLVAVENEIVDALVDFHERFPEENANDRYATPDFFRGGIAAMRSVAKSLRELNVGNEL